MDDFRILDHPADLGIEARGSTLAKAFENAASCLVSIILDPATVEKHEERSLHLTASDPEQLLVKWLEEILYLYDGAQFVVREAEVLQLSPGELKGVVRGERFSIGKHVTRLDVKAITYHQLSIRETPDGAVVTVFLDI